MRLSNLLVVAFSLVCIASAQAQYQINLNGEITGDHYSGDNSSFYTFSPFITATNNGGPATAFVTLSSPDGSFQGYVNNPSSNTATSSGMATTADLVTHANGTWLLSIVDGSDTFDYNVNVSLALPFASLPFLTSPDLVSGNTFNGTILFAMTGGSPTYPGAGIQFHAVMNSPDFSTQYANNILPAGSTSWTPTGVNFSGATQALAEIFTIGEAVDSAAFQVSGITPLSNGEPTVTFGPTNVTCRAVNSALLNVPEPASLSLLALLPLALGRRSRSKCAS